MKDCQVSHDKLLKDLKAMLESGFTHDVTFSVDGHTLPAHRAILCSRSPKFHQIFRTFEALGEDWNCDNFVIKDYGLLAFKCFLLFLYTGKVDEDEPKIVFDLYSLAEEYNVDSLHKECFRILSSNMSTESACRVLVFADEHRYEELKEDATIFIRENFTRVVKTKEWTEIVASKPGLASEVLGFIQSLPGTS